MNYSQILIRQYSTQGILLLREGLFWRGYEQSAYMLHRLFGFKPTKKFIKRVGQEVVSVGFPMQSLSKYFPNVQPTGDEVVCKVAGMTCSEQDFAAWKSALPLRESKPATHSGDGQDRGTVLSSDGNDIQRLIDKIRAFPLERSTPIECMNFVAEIKEELPNSVSASKGGATGDDAARGPYEPAGEMGYISRVVKE